LAWIYLIIASAFEVCWIYSLKYVEFKKLIAPPLLKLVTEKSSFFLLLPAIAYLVFGVGNIIFFSKALKEISPSVAYAVWMALALVGIKVTDVVIFHEAFTPAQMLFSFIVLVGIIGMKIYS
jgi:quaternary ammonium compound-resistance protein SugE